MPVAAMPFGKKDGFQKPCPICGKPADVASTPFCSKRCADIDLHKWLRGVYVVPDDEPGAPDEGPPEESDR